MRPIMFMLLALTLVLAISIPADTADAWGCRRSAVVVQAAPVVAVQPAFVQTAFVQPAFVQQACFVQPQVFATPVVSSSVFVQPSVAVARSNVVVQAAGFNRVRVRRGVFGGTVVRVR